MTQTFKKKMYECNEVTLSQAPIVSKEKAAILMRISEEIKKIKLFVLLILYTWTI